MADATTPETVNESENPRGMSTEIADAVTIFKGRFTGIRGPDHATTQGYLDSFVGEAGMFFGGLLESADGLTEKLGATGDSPPPEGSLLLLPRIIRRVTVTGVASRADILKPVYATDNQTLTLTRPSTFAIVIGVVVEWHSSTTADVLLFGIAVQAAIDLAGGELQILYLGSIDFGTSADGDLKTGIPMPFHGELLELFTITEATLVGAGGTILVNAEINAVNVTGGVVTVSTAVQAAVAFKSAGTAITALNTFHQGQLLDIEGASAGGTRTSGSVGLYAVVSKKLGA